MAQSEGENPNYRQSENTYKINTILTFNQDNTCTITSKDPQIFPGIADPLTWEIGYIKNAKGKYLPVIVITDKEGRFSEMDYYTTQDWGTKMSLVISDLSKNYLIIYRTEDGFNKNGEPIYEHTYNLWRDYYRRIEK